MVDAAGRAQGTHGDPRPRDRGDADLQRLLEQRKTMTNSLWREEDIEQANFQRGPRSAKSHFDKTNSRHLGIVLRCTPNPE
eukprot:7308824-Pyramimonas_sp.AAC.1